MEYLLKEMKPRKDPITRNTHVKYQSSSQTVKKLLARLKFSKKWVKRIGQGHRVKNNGTHGEVLSQGIKFQRERQNYRMTDKTKQYAPRSSISGA